MATIKTKAPAGLTITRKNGVFTCGWKNGDQDYKSGINVWILYNKKTAFKGAVNVGATQKSVSINLKKKFKSVRFNVQGKRAPFDSYTPTMSAWSYKAVKITKPPTPSAYFSLNSEKVNQGKFTWSVPDSYKESRMAIFEHYEWQSIVTDHYNSDKPPKKWPKKGMKKGEGTRTAYSKSFVEESAYFRKKDYSFTRWFRVRSVGPAGASAWKYVWHVYAIPKPATDLGSSLVKKIGGGYLCEVHWKAPNSNMYPVDVVNVEYAIGAPVTTSKVVDGKMVTEWTPPENLSWKNAGAIRDTTGWDGLQFQIDTRLEADQCIYVRVLSTHDENTVSSEILQVSQDESFLSDVSAESITPNPTTHRVVVTAQNPSEIPNSFIAVYYRTSDMDANASKIIGIIPKGTSSATIQCPDWGTKDVSFGLRAYLADYSPATIDYTTVQDYQISNIKMMSKNIVWSDSNLPKAPQSVVLRAVNPTTINVMWDWAWSEANQAELSWADHDDAWMSTNQPASYLVDNIYNSSWNIAGLNVGTWYVRVRLNKVTDSAAIYGMWSDIQEIKLSSAPAIPSLDLSDSVVTEDGDVTCYWAYASTDGTAQVGADICEAFYDEETSTYTYGEPFAHANTSQHLTFSVEGRGWKAGEKHYLAVRVTSASGETSAEWSVPAALTVADPPTCQITSSSLIARAVDTGGYETAYDPKYEPTSDAPISQLVPTTDTDLDPDTIYYTSTGEVVLDPVVEDISTYYVSEYIGGLDQSKTYYTQSGDEEPYTYTKVVSPVIADLPTYYEMIDIPEINPNKDYFTREEVAGAEGDYIYTKVVSPTISDIQNYYVKVFANEYTLDRMPINVTVAGAGEGSTTTLAIERAADYHMVRPDESEIDGFEGETVYLSIFDTDGSFTVESDALIGYLDDGASYNLVATTIDAQGQSAEASLEFTVKWAHQASTPVGTVEIDDEYDIAILTPTVPSGVTPEEGDVCDIYRLSIDRPKLVYSGANFGSRYVDPYPTIGDKGGYRFVYRTFNGDYTTDDNSIAWYNTPEHDNPTIERFTSIINFGDDRVSLPYNISLNNKWSKDFQQTAYLGGSIQGDWNPGVKRTGSISTVGIVDTELGSAEDNAVIELVRRLAEYSGVCHIRTPDGSNIAANVNVTEDREEKMVNKIARYSLEITGIDSEGLDGMTYDEWIKRIEE